MADEKPATPETPTTDDAGFTPAERSYMRQEEGATPPPEPPPETPSETPAEPPAEAAQPSETPSAPREPPKDKAQPATVPHGALAEERERRRQADERARQAELLNVRMEERLRAWEGRQQQPQQPTAPAAPPSPDQDIFGAVKHTMQKLDATTAEIEAYKRQIAQNEQVARLNKWAADCVQEYRKTQPDYLDAYRFLRESRAHELRSTWKMSDPAIGEQLATEELHLMAQAARQRRNAAEIVYSNARARGYKPAAASAPAPAPAAPDATRQMDVVEHGQQANKSLSGMGGRAGGGVEMTIENLLKMNDKEFEAFKNKNPKKFRMLKGATH